MRTELFWRIPKQPVVRHERSSVEALAHIGVRVNKIPTAGEVRANGDARALKVTADLREKGHNIVFIPFDIEKRILDQNAAEAARKAAEEAKLATQAVTNKPDAASMPITTETISTGDAKALQKFGTLPQTGTKRIDTPLGPAQTAKQSDKPANTSDDVQYRRRTDSTADVLAGIEKASRTKAKFYNTKLEAMHAKKHGSENSELSKNDQLRHKSQFEMQELFPQLFTSDRKPHYSEAEIVELNQKVDGRLIVYREGIERGLYRYYPLAVATRAVDEQGGRSDRTLIHFLTSGTVTVLEPSINLDEDPKVTKINRKKYNDSLDSFARRPLIVRRKSGEYNFVDEPGKLESAFLEESEANIQARVVIVDPKNISKIETDSINAQKNKHTPQTSSRRETVNAA